MSKRCPTESEQSAITSMLSYQISTFGTTRSSNLPNAVDAQNYNIMFYESKQVSIW